MGIFRVRVVSLEFGVYLNCWIFSWIMPTILHMVSPIGQQPPGEKKTADSIPHLGKLSKP